MGPVGARAAEREGRTSGMAPVNGGQVGRGGRRRRRRGSAGVSGHGSVTARLKASVCVGVREIREAGWGGATGGVGVHVSARMYAKGGTRVRVVRRKRTWARAGAGMQGRVSQRGAEAR